MKSSSEEGGGVRVVESAGSGIAAAYAGWLLARLGAHVTRFVAPDQADGNSPIDLTLRVLADGKDTQPCPATQAEFDAAAAGADILLCDAPHVGGTAQEVHARLPQLIIGIASTFGLDGPYAGFPGTGLDAQALSGVAWSLGDPEREPLSLPPGIVEHQGGVMLAAGSLLALQVRDACGSGRIVDIGLADVLASYVGGNCRVYIHHGLRWHRSGRRASGSGGAYPYVVLPCKDGEVCVFGRTPEEWARFVKVMGNPAWATEPRYQDLRALGQEYPDEGDRLIMPWLAEHTKAELQTIALENNLILSPIRNFADVLSTQQFSERKFFTTQNIDGQDIRVPGLPFTVTESRDPAAVNIAPGLLATKSEPPPEPPHPPAAQPLLGLRVLDLGWVWSAPWVSGILGELGAEVIKVEHAGRPDNLRLSGRVIRDGKKVAGPAKEMSPMFHQVNHGKLGITLNVKEPRAVEILHRLAGLTDLVVENMSPGAIDRTGLGYDRLREINPRIVMLSMSAAGQFGPQANMRAYAPNMSSAAGLESLVGYTDEAPIGALNFALGDPNASAHALTAVLAALRRARLTGQGAYIDLSQIEALTATLRPYLIDSQIHGRQSPTLGNGHPDFAPHGIYPAQEGDAWLTLAITTEAQWLTLTRIANGAAWAADPRYATNAARLAGRAELNAQIAGWTVTHRRDALVGTLRAAGIAASPVLSVPEQWRDPHYAARELKHPVTIPVYGEESLFRAPWRFSDFAAEITTCGPTTGQHNEQVLGGLLGLSAAEIEELRASGVVA